MIQLNLLYATKHLVVLYIEPVIEFFLSYSSGIPSSAFVHFLGSG